MRLASFLLFFFFVMVGKAVAEPPLLRLSLETAPITLDWNQLRTPTERFLLSFIMRGLYRYQSNGTPVCDLCTIHQISEDGKTHQITIHQEVKWSDGKPLLAQHFVDSLERLLNSKSEFPFATEFSFIERVRAKDAHELEIKLYHPVNDLKHLLTLPAVYPIRKENLDHVKKDQGRRMARDAVLGPYILAAWEKNKRIVLEGNPNYPLERPVYRVSFLLGKHKALFRRFKEGKLDIFTDPTTDEVMKHSGARIQVSPLWATRNLIFNLKHPLASNRDLRRAVLFTLDRSELASVVRNGERSATGLIPPGIQGHRAIPLVRKNSAKAQAERHKAAKWPGWVTLRFLFQANATEKRIYEWLRGKLEKIHLRLTPLGLSPAQYYKALEKRDFDLALHSWYFRTASAIDLLRIFSTKHPMNLMAWTHVGFDSLFAQLRKEANSASSEKLTDQLTRIVETQEIAAIPLSYPIHSFLFGPRVKNFALTPFGDPDLLRTEIR